MFKSDNTSGQNIVHSMAPSVDRSTSPLQAVLELLAQGEDTCRRISIRYAACDRLEGPLTTLLRQQTKTLQAELHYLTAHISKLQPDSDRTVISPEITQALASTKLRLFEVLELQHFYGREVQESHDGVLNAHFARRFIVGKNTRPDNETKLTRIGLELKDLLQEVLPASGRRGTFLQDAYQQFVPNIEDFVARTERQFRPRYVHTYDRFLDAPYILDGTAPAYAGSYGVVRMSTHKRTGEALAIKTFSKVFNDKTTSKILREAGILEVCNHKNIVRLVETFRTKDDWQSVHLVIAPWAPCTLHDFVNMPEWVRAAKCPWFQAASPLSDLCIYRIMYELADAVSYLHLNEIKHKDLKPDNILLYHEEDAAQVTPLITDFGVSKMFSKDAPTNFTDSTRTYLAPEQLRKESSTLRADIWQLGCCFAHLLALAGGGELAHEKLLCSYMRTADSNCSYIIAKEHSRFMDTLGAICMKGSPALKRVYGVVSGMLELDPSQRLEIETVRAELARCARSGPS